jgi:hypothetical protein
MEPDWIDRLVVIALMMDLLLTLCFVGACYGIPDSATALVF